MSLEQASLPRSGSTSATSQFQQYPEYHDSGHAWIGRLPSTWRTTKVKFLAKYVNGYAFSASDWGDEGRPIIRIQNLTGSDESYNYYDGKLPSRYLAEPGDLLISWSASLGMHRWTLRDAGWVNQHIYKVLPNLDLVTEDFLYWLGQVFMAELEREMHGSAMQHVTQQKFGGLEVPLPPKGHQQPIAEFLDNQTDKIDDLIAKKQRLTELLEEKRTALITKAVTKGLNPDVPMKDSGVEWLGEIPEHWDVLPLSTAIDGSYNGIWGDDPDGEHNVACLRVEDFDRFRATVRIEDPTIRSVEPRYRTQRQLEEDDLILEKSGGGEKQPVGFVVLVPGLDGPTVCSNFAARMPVRDGTSPSFLRYVFYHLYHTEVNTRSIKQTTGIQNLDADHYLSTPFALPPESTQREIAQFLGEQTAAMERLIRRVQEAINRLREYRSALITAAVTGKIDVRDHAA